jgi:hypothetical protein
MPPGIRTVCYVFLRSVQSIVPGDGSTPAGGMGRGQPPYNLDVLRSISAAFLMVTIFPTHARPPYANSLPT